MDFIVRDEELIKLDKLFEKDSMSTCIIYGRRRIGKSELIKKALSKINCKKIYYECKEVSELYNVNKISELISKSLD